MEALPLVTLSGRLLLAGTFALAAAAKWRDRDGSRASAHDLGVPLAAAPAVAALLPVVELAVAVGLVATPLAGAAAAAACALLGAFTVLVLRSLRLGRRPACGCFGAASAAPIGGRTVVRNVVLVVVAAAIAGRWWQAGSAAIGRYGDLTGAQVAGLVASTTLAAALGTLAWLVVHLVHQHGRLLARIESLESRTGVHRPSAPIDGHSGRGAGSRHRRRPGLAIGSPAPRFALGDLTGARVPIDDLLADGRPQVLLFLEPGCDACVAMADELATAAERGPSHDPSRAVVGIVRAASAADLSRFSPAGFDRLLIDPAATVSTAFGVQGTPSAVVVLPDGRIGSALAEGRAAVRRLVRRRDLDPGDSGPRDDEADEADEPDEPDEPGTNALDPDAVLPHAVDPHRLQEAAR